MTGMHTRLQAVLRRAASQAFHSCMALALQACRAARSLLIDSCMARFWLSLMADVLVLQRITTLL